MSFGVILLLAIAVARIAAFQSSFQVTPRNSVSAVTELRMSGNYYIKDDDAGTDKTTLTEIGGRTIDRRKTHMIFGVRCVETKHEISYPSFDQNTTEVVGLQPLNDLEDDSSDGTICTDNVEEGKTLTIVLNHLLSNSQPGRPDIVKIVPDDTDNDPHHDNMFELVEVGADPIVSLAAAKLLSGVGITKRTDRRVVVRHPDEQRLRVLEHAHLFFNEKEKTNPCSFQTEPLREDDPFVWLPSTAYSKRGDCVVLFTSPSLVSSRLREAITGIAAVIGPPPYRVLVPSAIISPEQLKEFKYRVVAGTENENSDEESPLLLEILS